MAKKHRFGEVCRLLDIQPYVLRYWETEFPALATDDSGGGQRTYSDDDIAVIRRIKELLYSEGFTLVGAKKKLQAELAEGPLSEAAEAPEPESEPKPEPEPEPGLEEETASEAVDDDPVTEDADDEPAEEVAAAAEAAEPDDSESQSSEPEESEPEESESEESESEEPELEASGDEDVAETSESAAEESVPSVDLKALSGILADAQELLASLRKG